MTEISSLENTKAVIRAILVSSQKPLTITELEHDYRKQEGIHVPFVRLGHKNLKSFLLSIPDVLTWDEHSRTFTPVINGNSGNAHIRRLVEGQKPPKPMKQRGKYSQNKPNHQNYSRNQFSLLGEPPSAYHQQNFDYNQQQSFNQLLSQKHHEPGVLLSRPGYYCPQPLLVCPPIPSLMSIVTTKPSNFSLNGHAMQQKSASKQRNGTNTKKSASSPNNDREVDVEPIAVVENRNGHAEISDDQSDNNIDALPPMDDDDPIRFLGTNMINRKYGSRIPPATIPPNLKTGDIRQICVTEIVDFPHFHFQFHDTSSSMRGLQENLNLRYENGDGETVRLSEVRIGNVCAVYTAGKWSRAKIIELPDRRHLLKLLCVDYGTIECVSIDAVRYLHKELCEYPCLSHSGTLAFLKPLHNYRNEKKIVDKFCEMVADKSLIAVFSNVDKDENISMTLVDTSSPTVDVIVNKILIEMMNEDDPSQSIS